MRKYILLAACIAMAMVSSGCMENDPGEMAPLGGGALSDSAKRESYVDGVDRAFQTFGEAQGQDFNRAINNGNKRQLQLASVTWNQGVAQLKQQDPPKDAVKAHTRIINATEGLSKWNQRLITAAPNKAKVKRTAKQASESNASKMFESSICELVELGYAPSIDPATCESAEGF